MILNTGFLLELNPTQNSLSIVGSQPHISNQNTESSSVSLCILVIHRNRFQRSLVQPEKGIWARPTVTSVNRQQKKYQSLDVAVQCSW